jgi:hypothetical protein
MFLDHFPFGERLVQVVHRIHPNIHFKKNSLDENRMSRKWLLVKELKFNRFYGKKRVSTTMSRLFVQKQILVKIIIKDGNVK